jgi:hypothetical protein
MQPIHVYDIGTDTGSKPRTSAGEVSIKHNYFAILLLHNLPGHLGVDEELLSTKNTPKCADLA